jgi:uncharacterized protein YndB with AHSA1/START domain
MKRDLKLEQFYKQPQEVVWKALTDPALVGRWLMPVEGFKPRKGTRFQFRSSQMAANWNGVVDCEVLETEAPRKLVYTWRGQNMDGQPGDFSATTVTWTLEPTRTAGGGTVLRLEHTGFEGFKSVLLSFMLGFGWKKKLRDDVADLVEALASEAGTPKKGSKR